MSLTRTAWVKLNRLCIGVGRFGSFMHKWGIASLAKCRNGASEHTADHIISTFPNHQAPRGIMGLTVLDDEQGAGSTPPLPLSDLGNAAG